MTAPDFTIADVLAWARTKPASERYDFCDVHMCAVSQFGIETGRAYLVGVGDLRPIVGSEKALIAIVLSDTFGELVGELERIVEPSAIKRFSAKLFGKTIGPKVWSIAAAPVPPSEWTRLDAYMADIEQVSA